jgi:osmotically-inducible protein OsmY
VASCSTGWTSRHGRTSARATSSFATASCTFWGLVGSPQEHKALLALAEQVAGVKSVSDETFPAY